MKVKFVNQKVPSDISQSIKNISNEITFFGQNVNNESSLLSIARKRCRYYDDSNYIITKKLKSNKSSFLIYDLNTSSMATSHKKSTNKDSSSDMTMNYTTMRYSNRYHWKIHLTCLRKNTRK